MGRLEQWCSEPHQLFFPLGMLSGFLGIALWIYPHDTLFGLLPSEVHASIMIQGFMTAFAFGVLGTAMPRMLGTGGLTKLELLLFWMLAALHLIFSLVAQIHITYWLYIALMIGFTFFVSRTVLFRKAILPPSFIYILFGCWSGLVGTVLKIFHLHYLFANALLYQSSILYLIAGFGGVIFPILFAREGKWRESYSPFAYAITFMFALALLWVTWIEYQYYQTAIYKLILMSIILLYAYPSIWRFPRQQPFYRVMIWSSIVFTLLGLAFKAFFPQYRMLGLHTLFMGGFSLIVMGISIHLRYAHNDLMPKFITHQKKIRLLFYLVISATIIRITAQYTTYFKTGMAVSSIVWCCAAGVWWLISYRQLNAWKRQK